MPDIDLTIAKKIARQASREFEAGIKFKQPRQDDWNRNEDLYLMRRRKTISGRSSVPLPIMSGFVDTSLSKLDEQPVLKFGKLNGGDLRVSNITQKAWEVESSSRFQNWARKDRNGTKLATLTGRAIYSLFGSSNPKYGHRFRLVDNFSFVSEPFGPSDLSEHRFKYEDDIFKTKTEIKASYDPKFVAAFIAAAGKDRDNATSKYRNKLNRFSALGLGDDVMSFRKNLDGDIYRLAQGFTFFDDEEYYILYDPETEMPLRCVLKGEMFESTLDPFCSWATHEDPFNFLSKAPADDIRPVNIAMDMLFNLSVENLQKRQWGQRAFDPDVFADPSQLTYRHEGLVIARPKAGKSIAEGIYEFETPDVNGSVNMIGFLDGFLGIKTGITPSAQGQSDKDTKASVYFGDLQQVSDRIGLTNKSKVECHEQLGIRYADALWEHATEEDLLEMVGEDAYGWDELKRVHKSPRVSVTITGSATEQKANEMLQKRKSDTLLAVLADPALRALMPSKPLLTSILRSGGLEEDEIRVLTDQAGAANAESLAFASQAIQDIVAGEETPKLYRGADEAFMQKIIDFAADSDLDDDVKTKLYAYAAAHETIATENMVRRAHQDATKMAVSQMMQNGGAPVPPGAPVAPAMPRGPIQQAPVPPNFNRA